MILMTVKNRSNRVLNVRDNASKLNDGDFSTYSASTIINLIEYTSTNII